MPWKLSYERSYVFHELMGKYLRTLGRRLGQQMVHPCVLIGTYQNQVPNPNCRSWGPVWTRVISVCQTLGIISLPGEDVYFSSALWRFLVMVNCFHWFWTFSKAECCKKEGSLFYSSRGKWKRKRHISMQITLYRLRRLYLCTQECIYIFISVFLHINN